MSRSYSLTALSLLLLGVAGGCSSSDTLAEEPVAIWIAPPGTYHLENPSTEGVGLDRLEGALREALTLSRTPALAVNAYQGTTGYDYIMLRSAACRAGAERILLFAEIPAGSTDPETSPADRRGEEVIDRPCPAA